MVRRSQRSEVCKETWVVMNMDDLPGFDDRVGGFRYGHDAGVRNWYQPAGW